MPLTFTEAYAIVCTDGRPVAPHSQDFKDIIELMRQSGHVPLQERLVSAYVPKVPQTVIEAQMYDERQVQEPVLKISKNQWMSIAANHEAFLEARNKK